MNLRGDTIKALQPYQSHTEGIMHGLSNKPQPRAPDKLVIGHIPDQNHAGCREVASMLLPIRCRFPEWKPMLQVA